MTMSSIKISNKCSEIENIYIFITKLLIILIFGGCFRMNQSTVVGNQEPFLVETKHQLNNDALFDNEKITNYDKDRFIFSTTSLPKDLNFMPTLSNGHIGFTVLSNEVFMNGLYNGKAGLSHRAKIPNFVNIIFEDCLNGPNNKTSCNFSLNMHHGFFMTKLVVADQFIATHMVYPHRYRNRLLINQIYIHRLNSKDNITLKIVKYPVFKEKIKVSSGSCSHNECNGESEEKIDEKVHDDFYFTKNETMNIDGNKLYLMCGQIRELEDENAEKMKNNISSKKWKSGRREEIHEKSTKQEKDVCVLWNHVPEEITLNRAASSISYKFVMVVDKKATDVKQEMMNVLNISDDELTKSHTDVWKEFWRNFQIEIEGDDEMYRSVISSVFYLVSNLPFKSTHQAQHPFYGLSPTGLGRGNTRDDYEGHIFWDQEIFMFTPVAVINPYWAKELLHYRFMMLSAAQIYAKSSGYRGSRFPWESAATGIEVIQPGYEYIAKYQQHISGDIAFAVQLYFSLTHDVNFMETEGCTLATDIAEFWESRVEFNEESQHYDINSTMGPDEDHININNNIYTNVIAKKALLFGSFARCFCRNTNKTNWKNIADKIKIPYDPLNDYHPQFDNYEIGQTIKQADAILIGYPLQFKSKSTSRLNDLRFYKNVIRPDGPAMSFSMLAINYFEVNELVIAQEMLIKSYKPYISKPFYIWNEVAEGEVGATNFVTGAGGFLQTVFNGILGLRFHLDHLELIRPQLPLINVTKIYVRGFSYLGSKFSLKVDKKHKKLTFFELNDDLRIVTEQKVFDVIKNVEYDITNDDRIKIYSKSKTFMKTTNCKLKD